LLKKAVSGLLPPSVLARRKKGFGIPVRRWLREVPPRPPLAALPGIRTPWAAERWRAFRAGEADERLFLWSWLSLQSVINGVESPLPPAGAQDVLVPLAH